jgi:hypothetical protein
MISRVDLTVRCHEMGRGMDARVFCDHVGPLSNDFPMVSGLAARFAWRLGGFRREPAQ